MIKDNVFAKTEKNVIYIKFYSYGVNGELCIAILCNQIVE
jgi:hypothetical protein